eukprot:TRINITY_DN7128_c0_g1_i1.p1 TRINITY_DN7128_c0_g1~~TRINITY_DN7128_c0_g1_i1.p1  ORF type:complete len:1995 (+),score=422.61 TRINITY_DN7128_c0_g1_i1:669-5987(+)
MPLLDHLRALVDLAVSFTKRKPRVIVIGAAGRCGRGAVALATELGLDVTQWGRADTSRHPGPFPELLAFDVLVNAVKLAAPLPQSPFLTPDLVRAPGRALSLILDFSCDVSHPHNPLPLYAETTSFSNPAVRVIEASPESAQPPLDVIAIPNLPALLATESSRDFSAQFLPLLLSFSSDPTGVFARASQTFRASLSPLLPVPGSAAGKTSSSFAQERFVALESVHAAQLRDHDCPVVGAYNIGRILKLSRAASAPPPAKRRSTGASNAELAADKVHQLFKAAISALSLSSDVLQFEEVQADDLARTYQPLLERPFDRGVALRVAHDAESGILMTIAHRSLFDEVALDGFLQFALSGASAGPSALTFADFARWQHSLWESCGISPAASIDQDPAAQPDEDGAFVEAACRFWVKSLSGSIPIVQLPTDHTRAAIPTFVCSTASHTLSPGLSRSLVALASSCLSGVPSDTNTRLTALLLTMYVVFLHRVSAEEDVIVSALLHNGRTRPGFSQLFGPMLNPVLLRTTIPNGNPSFSLLLQAVHAQLTDALPHSEMPLPKLLSLLHADASDHAPFSRVQFLLSSALAAPAFDSSSSVAASPVEAPVHLSEFDLRFEIDDRTFPRHSDASGSGLRFSLHYNVELFSLERIQENIRQFELLLTQAVQDPHRGALSYTMVTEHARSILPDPHAPLDGTFFGPIYRHFSRQARERPDRPAIIHEGHVVTYRVLDELTNQLANRLVAAGIKPEDIIGLYGHRSPAVVWAIMGILKAGAGYTMMDPAYPFTRIQACVEIANIKGWIEIGAAVPPPPELRAFLDSLNLFFQISLPAFERAPLDPTVAEAVADVVQNFPATDPDIDVEAHFTTVVTFTSGSTGQPKGVMGRHGSLTHFYPWMAQQFGIGENDRFSMTSGIAHDPLQRDIFTPLFFGAPILIPTQETVVTPGRLAAWMAENQVTTACLTPAMGQLLTTVDNPTFTIASLRAVFFVGDCLIKRDVFRLRKLAPNVRCINMYGSTETQRSVGFYEVPKSDEALSLLKEVIPCGVGMKDCSLMVVNNFGQFAGVGETAEIYMRSPHMAKGYVGLEEQTRARFFVNPFLPNADPQDRFYKTGDLGRYMPDGNVECSGRADDQVKIRGFRIELGEVNATLSKHICVKENVTIVREDVKGDKRLVSYVVPTNFDADGSVRTSPINVSELAKLLQAHLKAKLPSYMVPSGVVLLSAMPLTPNGKINRDALPPPSLTSPGAAAESGDAEKQKEKDTHSLFLQTLSPTEAKMVPIWSEILNTHIQSVTQNFFDLGGHSLLATQLNLRLRQAFSVEIPMHVLFADPTIKGVSAALDSLSSPPLSLHSPAGTPKFVEDAVLPPDFACKFAVDDAAVARFAAPTAILLTGATGFVGAFLLQSLLKRTTARIFCHVRASSVEEGKARLVRSLALHSTAEPPKEWVERIECVPGDLGTARLGIEPALYDRLAHEVDIIVHNGAFVHWLFPYEHLRAANVGGTLSVLELAVQGKVKALHHISTTSVFDTTYHAALPAVGEDDDLSHYEGLTGGYPQTKWVAEKLVTLARARGVPTAVYRPGYVTGDSAHGVWNVDDFLCRFVKGCIQLGAAPDAQTTIDMSPVDYVADCVVSLALTPRHSVGRSFNVVNPVLFTHAQLRAAISSFGYSLETVPYPEWRASLLRALESGNENALSPLLSYFTPSWGTVLNPIYKQDNVAAGLEGKLVCPQISTLLSTYFAYFLRCGFLAPPPQSAAKDTAGGINWKLIGEGVAQLTRTGRHK